MHSGHNSCPSVLSPGSALRRGILGKVHGCPQKLSTPVEKVTHFCGKGLWASAGRPKPYFQPCSSQTPDVPRLWLSTKWVSMIPTASMRAYMVVGPTNAKPFLRSALDRATDSGDVVGISSEDRGAGGVSGLKDHTKSTKPPSALRAMVALALVMAAWIFRRFRTMPASSMSRSTSASVKAATLSG